MQHGSSVIKVQCQGDHFPDGRKSWTFPVTTDQTNALKIVLQLLRLYECHLLLYESTLYCLKKQSDGYAILNHVPWMNSKTKRKTFQITSLQDRYVSLTYLQAGLFQIFQVIILQCTETSKFQHEAWTSGHKRQYEINMCEAVKHKVYRKAQIILPGTTSWLDSAESAHKQDKQTPTTN